MNLHLPDGARPPQGGLLMGKLNINVQRIEGDVVGGSAVSLGVQQTGPNEATAPIVSVGGVSKLEFLAAQLMPWFLGKCKCDNHPDGDEWAYGVAAAGAVASARAIQKASRQPAPED